MLTYTEQELQDLIHSIYEGDDDTPDVADEEYTYRRRLMNLAVNRWENDKGYLWNELWTSTELDEGLAETQVSGSQTEYETAENFRFPGGYVFIGGNPHKVVQPYQLQQYEGSAYVYFLGNYKDGHKLVIPPHVAQANDGKEIKYDFYKRASAFNGPTSQCEMSDPMYVVHAACTELFKSDNNSTMLTHHAQEAEERIRQMEIRNMQDSHYQGVPETDNFGGVMGM